MTLIKKKTENIISICLVPELGNLGDDTKLEITIPEYFE